MDTDWSKVTSLILGTVGSVLGTYNFIYARRDRIKKERHNYATTLLALEPILELIVDLPIESPRSLHEVDRWQLSEDLRAIEEALRNAQKDLVTLAPEWAEYILLALRSSKDSRRALNDPHAEVNAASVHIALFLKACFKLAKFRQHASYYKINLLGQSAPTDDNFYGDEVVKLLSLRWQAFAMAT